MKKVWNRIKKEKYIQRYVILLVALFVAAINYNLFLRPLKIVTGGLNGLSIMFEEIFLISPSWFMLIFSIITLIIGYLCLGTSKTVGAVVGTFIYPFFVKITENIGDILVIDKSDMLMIAIFTGVIGGVVSGVICRINLSQGGVMMISQSIANAFRVSVSKINLMINLVVVVAGSFFFGFHNALYAAIVLYISSIVMNRIILGISNKKFIYIMTDKIDLVKTYVVKEMKYGITEFDAVSGNSGNEKRFLMTVVATNDYMKVTRYVKSIDKNAFFVVTDSYQTSM